MFAIFGHPEAAAHAALGLHALQHRGQEAAGIYTFDGQHFHHHKALGLVGDSFSSPAVIQTPAGPRRDRPHALRHDRRLLAAQRAAALRRLRLRRPRDRPQRQPDQRARAASPARRGGLALPLDDRHRGHRPPDRQQPEGDASSAASPTRSGSSRALGRWSALFDGGIFGVRDPLGVRPLVLGRLDDAYILASETCALDIMGAELVRDVEPGEIVVVERGGRPLAAPVRRPGTTASASSSTSTSPGPTAWSRAGASTRSGSASAWSWRAKRACRPTWSSPSRTAACRPRSATRKGPACRSSSASSATTMSAGPSSSRPTASATSACG